MTDIIARIENAGDSYYRNTLKHPGHIYLGRKEMAELEKWGATNGIIIDKADESKIIVICGLNLHCVADEIHFQIR